MSVHNRLKALDPYWDAIQTKTARAETNLTELQPQTTQLHNNDDALNDKRAVDHCVNLIIREIVRLHALVAKWDYPVAGEIILDDTRHTNETWENKHAEAGCTNCGQPNVMIWSPIDPHSKDLCTWCARFERATSFRPTPLLVTMHDQGRRMSQAIVDRELKPLRDAARKTKATRRPSRKKGTKTP